MDIRLTIDSWWDKKPHGKLDWLALENIQRDILCTYQSGQRGPTETIELIDEALAAFTRRGSEIKK